MQLSRRNIVGLGLAVLLGLTMAGCGHWRWPRLGKAGSASGLRVVPGNNRYALMVTLTADDIVTMMVNVGFTEKQIFELGEELRNALMLSGAAQVRQGKTVEALFAASENDCIYITTRMGSTFIYDARRGQFGLGQGPGAPSPRL